MAARVRSVFGRFDRFGRAHARCLATFAPTDTATSFAPFTNRDLAVTAGTLAVCSNAALMQRVCRVTQRAFDVEAVRSGGANDTKLFANGVVAAEDRGMSTLSIDVTSEWSGNHRK